MAVILKLTITLFFVLWCECAIAYNLPLGIPDPGWGIGQSTPAPPSDWAAEVPGYYYIQNITGCSDSLTYGHSGAPRCTIPDPIPAGSYVEIHGTYSTTVGGFIPFRGTGTVDNPIWIVGVDATLTDMTRPVGSYIYVENIKGHFTGVNDAFNIGYSGASGYAADHIMFRNCIAEGDGVTLTHGFNISGYIDEPTHDIIIVDSIIRNHGTQDAAYDLDAHAIITNAHSSNIWVLNNEVYSCGGSGIVFGQEGPTPTYTDIQWGYAGGNHVYDTQQAALAVKDSWHIVFSENIAHDQITRWVDGIVGGTVASPSKCFGWKGEPQDFWVINNTCYNDSYGVHGGSTDTGDWYIYIVGNTFRDIYANKPAEYDGTNAWNEAAISMVGGNHVYAINNSINNSVSGIMTPGSGTLDKYYYIENNIIASLTGTNYSHINSENSYAQTITRNNVVYQSSGDVVYRWGSSTYTSLSDFNAATGQGSNSIQADPLYTSANNLRPQNGSVANDSGLGESELSFNVYAQFQSIFGKSIRQDIDGVPRPHNQWDIGAYENGALHHRTGAMPVIH